MTKKPILSRPRDRTWQAYRDWISEVTKFLNPDSDEAIPDAEWQELAEDFWRKRAEEKPRSADDKRR